MATHGKNIIIFMILIAMMLTILAGCAKEEEQTSAGTISDFDSQTHFQVGTSGEESASGDTSNAPVSGEFVVSEKRYSYEGTDLMVLFVENQTDRHYNVTINGTYFDENGETLKTESQTFEGFAAKWQNYFIFRPEMDFERFEYSLEVEENKEDPIHYDTNGVPYSSNIELRYEKKLQWIRGAGAGEVNFAEMRDLVFQAELVNHHETTEVAVEFYLILLNNDGEIYYCSRGEKSVTPGELNGSAAGPVGSEEDGHFPVMVRRQDIGKDETIPANVQDVFTAIFAFEKVVDVKKYMEQFD